MKRKGGAREVSVGVTLMLALALLAGLILMLGKETRILRPRISYATTVDNSLGLKTGSPVVMGGVQVGAVTDVRLPEDPRGKGITVLMSIDRGYSERIREGSLASVGFITLLSGEKYVEISAGDPGKPALPGGAMIPRDTSTTLLQTGQNVAENLADVTNQLRGILADIRGGQGLLGEILTSREPYFGKEAVENITATFGKANRILGSIDKGEGTVGRLVKDEDFARETLDSIKSAAGRIDRVLESVEKREGALGDLLKDDGRAKQVLENLKMSSESLKNIAAKLETKTGLLGRLLNDPEYSEKVATDLRNSLSSLASILRKIDKGEGSLGAFVNNPSVYKGVEDIVSGLSKSRLAKGALRHYGKKGAKESGEGKTESGGGSAPQAPQTPPSPPPSGAPSPSADAPSPSAGTPPPAARPATPSEEAPLPHPESSAPHEGARIR